jgi:GH24 family phage-related lysozyme (muramidase)
MDSDQKPRARSIPAIIVGKGIVPAALLAALTSPLAYFTLERWEGNVLQVYVDRQAGGVPTYCAGRTDPSASVGTRLTSDECREVNKATLLEYGYAVLDCVDWNRLTAKRLIGLTMFAINVGKQGACGSQAVRLLNAGRIAQGCDALAFGPDGKPAWSYAGGRYVQGLQNRRQAERVLCMDGAA